MHLSEFIDKRIAWEIRNAVRTSDFSDWECKLCGGIGWVTTRGDRSVCDCVEENVKRIVLEQCQMELDEYQD